VGRADIAALTTVATSFTDLDHRLGGGHARTTLLTYVNDILGPLLHGRYSAEIGADLLTAAARLLDLLAFMSFDAGYQALATRYYASALAMVRTSGDRALTAHILTDMAMQACHLDQPGTAVSLAEAATDSARRCDAHRAIARSYAVLARCRALAGDAAGCDQAISAADKALDHAVGDDPHYVRFFDDHQLATEAMYAAGHLARWRAVRATSDVTTTRHEVMQRRHVLATATLACTFLIPGVKTLDVPRACDLVSKVVPLLPSLASARSLDAINQVRRSLAKFHHLHEVQTLEYNVIEALAAGP